MRRPSAAEVPPKPRTAPVRSFAGRCLSSDPALGLRRENGRVWWTPRPPADRDSGGLQWEFLRHRSVQELCKAGCGESTRGNKLAVGWARIKCGQAGEDCEGRPVGAKFKGVSN